ncbi:Peptidoglycan/xylan/chitin deacetylase, PgdA/CDA1 family [Planococcus glaciei]|uniref:polysaccharide deacetylase family protein n=1 Tax=Planococcus glaciei TaxID=459472 RepID=UPI00088C642C|nr:polysaccharide deacetylase family protein [Planococcus glaciei]SDH71615.1 Peptidoglycan/xylan/chitin deacetylase, PgdA/CDA1 family [Planococcus glaciei]
MVHTKGVLLAAALALLTACNAENAEPETEKGTPDTEQAVPETTEKDPEEKTEVEQTEVPAEKAEEPAKLAAEPKYRLNPANWNMEPISDAPAEAVLITIDDAPADHSVEMAETLKKLDVPAIFFVNGHFLDSDEEKANLKKIHEMGFAIGNHTYNHNNLKTIGEEQQQEEILSLSEAVGEIIGEKPKFFRAPNGSNTDFSKALIAQEGMLLMNWTYGYDWEKQYMDAAALTDIMVNTEFLRNGANLLMHDREWTAQALPGIIEGLRAKGYSFVEPDEIEGVK